MSDTALSTNLIENNENKENEVNTSNFPGHMNGDGPISAIPKHLLPGGGSGRRLSKVFQVHSVDAKDDPLFNVNVLDQVAAQRKLSATNGSLPNLSSLSNDLILKEDNNIRSGSDHMVNGNSSFILPPKDQLSAKQEPETKEIPTEAEKLPGSHLKLDVSLTKPIDSDALPLEEKPTMDRRVSLTPPVVQVEDTSVDMNANSGVTTLFVPPSTGLKLGFEPEINHKHSNGKDSLLLVPGYPSENSVHETITSTYETNISINNLLRERHKGSLAAVGRLFKKQSDINAYRASSLTATTIKPKKNRCEGVKAIHIILAVWAAVIVCSATVTLVLFQKARKLEAANRGYNFDYSKQLLEIYSRMNHSLLKDKELPIFQAKLGVNINRGLPNNCSRSLNHYNRTTDLGCFRWQNAATLNMSIKTLDADSFCINIHWESFEYEPLLEDCFSIGTDSGYWFGGFSGEGSFPLGNSPIDTAYYLPGATFGNMVERFWISSKGIAVVAAHDFPLQLKITNGADRKLCMSSWYGYLDGLRKMSYSVCRSSNHTQVHKHVMENFYSAMKKHKININDFENPIYSVGDHSDLSKLGTSYSYIMNKHENIMALIDQENSPFQSVPLNKQGVNLSPIVNLTDPRDPEFLDSDLWLKATDLAVTRLFKINGTLSLLVNTSSDKFSTYLHEMIPSDDMLVKISEAGLAHVTAPHLYSITEIKETFQQYNQKLVDKVNNQTNGIIMTSVLTGMDRTSVIVSLPPITDLRKTIKMLMEASLMGYNLINAGEINNQLSPEQFIRAIQLAIFMPVIEISENVFTYNNQTLDAMRSWLKIRKEWEIIDNINYRIKNDPLTPLFTPIWWHNPKSKADKFDIVDEFVIAGQDRQYLLAPIIDVNSKVREVYFPPGNWGRHFYTSTKQSRQFFRGDSYAKFNVTIDDILVFENVECQQC